MGKVSVVSFEDTTIKVVYATLKKKAVSIDDVLTLKDDQFDDFLLKEKTKEFIVVNSFRDFFQDTILIPPTKKRFIRKLLELEIKKRIPFNDFSFIYSVTGEKIVGNRRMKEVFFFAVNNEELRGIINRFILRGKVVKAIYPDIFSLACQIGSEGKHVICISETELNKNLFLVKNGAVEFIRTAQALEHGMSNLDIQNINMTVNYCRQTLRINPSHVILIGSLCRDYNTTNDTIIPIACLFPMSLVENYSLYLDFISPLSAILIPKDKDINLLPSEYKNFFRIKLFLKCSTAIFLTLSVIGIGYIGYIGKNIIELKNRTDAIRATIPDVDNILITYDIKKTEMSEYMPFVNSLRNAASIPDIQEFLSLFSYSRMDNIKVNSIYIIVADTILNIDIKGSVKAEGYANIQRYYQKFIDSLTNIKSVIIKDYTIGLENKDFSIKITWGSQ